jgi:hypothetical protein
VDVGRVLCLVVVYPRGFSKPIDIKRKEIIKNKKDFTLGKQ